MNRSEDSQVILTIEKWRDSVIANLTRSQRQVVEWLHNPECSRTNRDKILRLITDTPIQFAAAVSLWDRLTMETRYTLNLDEEGR